MPGPGLGMLAALFPAETPLYVALSTVDADLDTLDAVLHALARVMPDQIPADMTVQLLLDMVSQQALGRTFDHTVGPWLGDSAALAILDLEPATASQDEPPLAIALSVTDRAALDAFLAELVRVQMNGEATMERAGAYMRYTFSGQDGLVLLAGDDILLLANPAGEAIMTGEMAGSLADRPGFHEALALLPAASYNLAAFFDAQQIGRLALEEGAVEGISPAILDLLLPAAYPATALGVAVLEGRGLVIDIARPLAADLPPEVAATAYRQMPPIDPAFAVHVPADTLFMLHGTDISTVAEMVAETFRAQLSQILALGGSMIDSTGASPASPDEMLAEVQAAFTEATGLDLEQDVLGWMTGDYALFLQLDAAALTGATGMSGLEFGIAVEAVDPGAAAATRDGLLRAIRNQAAENVTLSQVQIGQTKLTVATSSEGEAGLPSEALLGLDGNVLAFGTRRAMEAVFAPAGGGLAAAPRFQAAQAFLLDGASALWYFNLGAMGPAMLAQASAAERENMTLVLDLVNSITLSSLATAEGANIARLAIDLGE